MKNKGLFITLSGCDGVGKTSTGQLAVKKLINEGYDAIFLDMYYSSFSKMLRKAIMDHKNLSHETEAFTFTAIFQNLWDSYIRKYVNNGMIVIMDRWSEDTFVYDHLTFNTVSKPKAIIDPEVDRLAILIDMDPKVALKRIADNEQREVNKFDKMDVKIHKAIRENFLTTWGKCNKVKPKEYKTISVMNKSLEEVTEEVIGLIISRYKEVNQ